MWAEMDDRTRQVFDDYLFSKGFLVNCGGENRRDCVRALYALANVFGIKIVRGRHLAEWHMTETAARGIGLEVPLPFYTGFPQSVLELTEEQLLVDQLIHYAITYGLGDFSRPGHSLLEEKVERLAFREQTEIREFEILEESEALARLKTYVTGLLSSTRTLNAGMENLVVCYARLFPDDITVCACKDTAIRLLYETRCVRYARFIRLPDVIRLADEINWAGHLKSPSAGKLKKIYAREEAALEAFIEEKKAEYDQRAAAYAEYRAARDRYQAAVRQYEADLAAYGEKKRQYDRAAETAGAFPADEPQIPVRPVEPAPVKRPGRFFPPDLPDEMRADTRRSIRTLNLRNRDRKLISSVIDFFFDQKQPDTRDCYEKKQLWAGLLHQLHYAPKNEAAAAFVQAMRGRGENRSVWAGFEAAVAEGDVKKAAALLAREKGGSAVGRNLNYLLSRCRDASDVEAVISRLDSLNMTVLIQLLLQYRHYHTDARTFKFVRHHLLAVHHETEEEVKARRSVIPAPVRDLLAAHLTVLLQKALAERNIGRVYLEDGMERIAVPLQEASGSSGFGVLPRGSRIRIGEGSRLRCFTYWEKADDIDLACFGLGDDGTWQEEFSWRTMQDLQEKCVTFSGDETSGYFGGSEYYDVLIPEFRERYPDVRYLVFTDNVFRGPQFKDFFCTAGYMIRQEEDSGEIFEPKTVRSSFQITAESTFAVLFALDLKEWDLIWLNLGMDSDGQVAGDNEIAMVRDYLDVTEAFNLSMLFRGMASEVTDRPEDADVIVADHYAGELRSGQTLIRSCDFEKIHEYMNGPSGKKA